MILIRWMGAGEPNHRDDCAAQGEPEEIQDARRAQVAALPPALESRAAVRVAAKLPADFGAL